MSNSISSTETTTLSAATNFATDRLAPTSTKTLTESPRGRRGQWPWRPYECRVIVAIHRAFSECGLSTDYEHGVTDEGEPWTVFYEMRNGEAVAHVARDHRSYVLVWPDRHSVRASDLGRFVEVVRGSSPSGP